MANTVNFKNMNEDSYKTVYGFALARLAEAKEDSRHKTVTKQLRSKKDELLKTRAEKIVMGYNQDDAIRETSTLEIDNAMRVEDMKHDNIVKPLKEAMKNSYTLIPEGLYEAYTLKFEGKNTEFVNSVNTFLVGIGIECPKQGVVRKTADRIALMMGARLATSKQVLENNAFTSVMKKNQFNKLFMSAFIDVLVQAGFTFVNPNTTLEGGEE